MTQRKIEQQEHLARMIRAMRAIGGRKYLGAKSWLTLSTGKGPQAIELKEALGPGQNELRLGMFLSKKVGTQLDDMTLVRLESARLGKWLYAIRKEADAVFERANVRAAEAAHKARAESLEADKRAAKQAKVGLTPEPVKTVAPVVPEKGRTHAGVAINNQPPRRTPNTLALPPLAPSVQARIAEIEWLCAQHRIELTPTYDQDGRTEKVHKHQSSVTDILEVDQLLRTRGMLWKPGMSCEPKDYQDHSGKRAFQLLNTGDTSTGLHAGRGSNSWSPFD